MPTDRTRGSETNYGVPSEHKESISTVWVVNSSTGFNETLWMESLSGETMKLMRHSPGQPATADPF